MVTTKKIVIYVTYMLVGSIAFWLPSVIVHATTGYDFSPRHSPSLPYVQILSTLAALVVAWLPRGWIIPLRKIPPWMLLGIWMLGPFWLCVSATFTGGGLARDGGWLAMIVSILVFPVATPMLAVYDGTIPNLLMITI